jgi:hypothetical protein
MDMSHYGRLVRCKIIYLGVFKIIANTPATHSHDFQKKQKLDDYYGVNEGSNGITEIRRKLFLAFMNLYIRVEHTNMKSTDEENLKRKAPEFFLKNDPCLVF